MGPRTDAEADGTRRAHVLAARSDEREQALPVATLERDVRVTGGADRAGRSGRRSAPRADLEDGEDPLAVRDRLALGKRERAPRVSERSGEAGDVFEAKD